MQTITTPWAWARGFLFLAGLGIGTAHAQSLLEATSPGIVDMHCHVAGIGAGDSGCFVGRKMQKSWKFRIYLKAMGTTLDELEEKGDWVVAEKLSAAIARSKYVHQAVVLALDGVVVNDQLDRQQTQVYVPNEYVAELAKRHKNLLFGASVNPMRSDAIERLRWCKQNGAVLVKWLPSIMHFDPADARFDAFYDEMAKLDLTLLTHVGQEKSFAGAEDELCDPVRLTRALDRGVKVIAAHVASTGENEGEDNYDRLVRMFPKYPNLYADISSLTQINRLGGLNKALAQPEFKGRLVYGTDWPLQFFPLVSSFYQVGRVPLKEMWRISRIKNQWDKDVELKAAIGVPAELFVEARTLLNVPAPVAVTAPEGPELEAPTLEDPEMVDIMGHAHDEGEDR